MSDQSSYYAVIPASVRYATGLCPNAKLLFGEISALANQVGYCWAQNQYFAELYKVSKTTVSDWISQLQELGAIDCEMVKNSTGWQRRITLSEGVGKSRTPPSGNVEDPPSGKAEDKNNTRNNTQRERTRAQRLEAFLDQNAVIIDWLKWSMNEFSWPLQQAKRTFDTFRDHWKAAPGSKGVKADWETT